MDLSPKTASQSLFEGEGGSYYVWAGSDSPLLAETKVGAGKLLLKPNGFALPHYSDTSKVGYVLQGAGGVTGMVTAGSSKEVVLGLKKGDVIPVPLGTVSWWYNGGDTDLVIVFIGNTSISYVPGQISYFLLTGGRGILSGFSTEFISRSYYLDDKQATDLAKGQTGVLIIKLQPGKISPQPSKEFSNKMVYNIGSAKPDVEVKRGGVAKNLTGAEFSFLGEAGLSVNYVSLLANATEPPKYTADGTVQVVYVARGSGQVQIVGLNGKKLLDTKVEAGQLFVVPRLFVVAKTAANEGMECFSIVTSPRPIVRELGGMKSVWDVLSPEILQVALDANPDLEALFKSNIRKTTTIVPPSIGTN